MYTEKDWHEGFKRLMPLEMQKVSVLIRKVGVMMSRAVFSKKGSIFTYKMEH